ncbi:immunoglobulin domain-containing protein, partial [Streptomyces sp. NPDC046984]|uniref:immunoglobulin domain-containing protein n=1 Tax=Streptomyces sp. NPDC046984 TaxID=3155138 RepID=UPI0033FE3F0F
MAALASHTGLATASDPAFAAQPQPQTVPDGGSVTFAVDFPGARLYTWYRTDAKGSVPLPNSNTSTYTFTANYADDGATYSVKVFDSTFAQHTSEGAKLTVTPVAATVVEAPHDTSVQAYQTARFTVSAGGTGPFTYQWQRRDSASATWSDIAKATGADYAFKSRPADDGARFRVIVDNAHGPSATSTAAGLSVISGGGSLNLVDHASLEWGVNNIYQGGNPANTGCNFFSAGTQKDFRAAQGDVRIIHRVSDGTAQGISEATKCIPATGTRLNQRVLFTNGTGTANSTTGQATIHWDGAFTANAYSGLVTWYVKDPTLTIAEDGTGTLTATNGGMGSSRDNPGEQEELPARRVTVATFDQVRLDTTAGEDGGAQISPEFSGVDYFPLVDGVRSTASAIPASVKDAEPDWGSWPQSFVDFQYETGLSSYWHTSGLSADPDKPPFDLSVQFDSAPDVRDVPVILANPSSTATAPYVEGRDLTITADIDGDADVQWERSGSAGGPWTAIDGATREALTIPAIDSSWNNTYVRIVATNGDGQATSTALLLTTAPYSAPTFTEPPRDLAAIQGTMAAVKFRVTGNPAVDPDRIALERSDDHGATWKPWAGAQYSGGGTQQFTIPSIPLDANGASARIVAANAEGAQTVSDPFFIQVFRATGKPQLVMVPGTAVDPEATTRLTVLGAGFDVPDWASPTLTYSLDVGLFDANAWQPSKQGSRNWVATSPDSSGGQLYYDSMRASGGAFTIGLTVPAGKLITGHNYGIGAFLRLTDITTWQDTFDNRSLDAWTPVPLTTDPPASEGEQTITATVPEQAGEFTWTIDASD